MFPATVEEVVAANLYSNGSLFKKVKGRRLYKNTKSTRDSWNGKF